MIFHLLTELPPRVSRQLDHQASDLTSEERRILQQQIRKNSQVIAEYIDRLDLLVNKERYPRRAAFVMRLRRRLELLMEENDTFRGVLWKHYQSQEMKSEFSFI